MLRELQALTDKHAPTMYKAAEDMKAGMLVAVNETAGTVDLPASETTTDLYWVTKERIPTGVNAARVDFSDYEDEFINIKKGEFCKVIPIYTFERYASDQFGPGVSVGDMVASVKGVITKTTKAACLKCVGKIQDNGHELVVIKKVDPAAAGE